MAANKEIQDKHFPLMGHTIAMLYEPQKVFIEPYVTKGQVVIGIQRWTKNGQAILLVGRSIEKKLMLTSRSRKPME